MKKVAIATLVAASVTASITPSPASTYLTTRDFVADCQRATAGGTATAPYGVCLAYIAGMVDGLTLGQGFAAKGVRCERLSRKSQREIAAFVLTFVDLHPDAIATYADDTSGLVGAALYHLFDCH